MAMGDEPNAKVKVPKLICSKDTTKGVDSLRQQDGGHGSRYPLRSV